MENCVQFEDKLATLRDRPTNEVSQPAYRAFVKMRFLVSMHEVFG